MSLYMCDVNVPVHVRPIIRSFKICKRRYIVKNEGVAKMIIVFAYGSKLFRGMPILPFRAAPFVFIFVILRSLL